MVLNWPEPVFNKLVSVVVDGLLKVMWLALNFAKPLSFTLTTGLSNFKLPGNFKSKPSASSIALDVLGVTRNDLTLRLAKPPSATCCADICAFNKAVSASLAGCDVSAGLIASPCLKLAASNCFCWVITKVLLPFG